MTFVSCWSHRFGFDDADPYQALIVMTAMTAFYLLAAMLALQPPGYMRKMYNRWKQEMKWKVDLKK